MDTHSPFLVTLSRSEGSLSMGFEMLRGVYTERSECAQHDSTVHLPVFMTQVDAYPTTERPPSLV
jgi:hypothetical protein